MNKNQVFEYYSRPDILEQFTKNAKNREIVGAYFDGSYDQRPNIIQFPSDVTQMVKKGITSIHFSVEHWQHPMQLTKENYKDLRIGWDFIIDIDSKITLEEAKIAAQLITNMLEKYGIKKYGLKFSGRRGFHICLPWQSFPKEVDYKPLSGMYPDIPRILASFIRKNIAEDLMKEMIKKKGAKKLIEVLEESPDQMDPFYFVEVEKDWGPRHMFRAPYSLNEKTWLVSLPIKDIKNFSPDTAKPDKIKTGNEFFVYEENQAENLIIDAIDWHASQKKEVRTKPKRIINWEHKIPEEQFPPCMKLVLNGLADGRKRSIFTLISFLKMMNWPWHEIEQRVLDWNENNTQPLPRNIVIAQLRWNQQNSMNPANCDVDTFYKSIGICKPDETCKAGKMIKNPINYPFRKMKKNKKFTKREYKCSVCSKGFKSMKSLYIHKGRMHGQ